MDDSFYGKVQELSCELYLKALKVLPSDVLTAIKKAHQAETKKLAKSILGSIITNIDVSRQTASLVCQDTGIPVYFLKIGTESEVKLGRLLEAVSKGCSEATVKGDLRPNIVHPLTRVNSGTNTGIGVPVIHTEVDGEVDGVRIMSMPKGSGSENMGYLKMLPPSDGVEGVIRFVLESVIDSGGKGCPPSILGVGIGGSFDTAPRLAKKALIRPVGSRNKDPSIARLEEALEKAVNKTGIGPMGLGGDITTLAVHVETADTHISSLPVALNSQCWRGERAAATLDSKGHIEYTETI
jgi:tartrate/fumarate subfamily iron-sulfur-dependent hydro-lyase alpha chain